MWGVFLRHSMLALFLCGEFLLHIPCCLQFYIRCFSYTFNAGFFFYGEFLLLIPCWFIFYRRSFSYTCRAGFIFIWGVSLTHPVLASFLSGVFLLQIPRWFHFHAGSFSYTSRAVVVVVFKSHASFFFNRRSFSYTFRVGFIFLWGVSLTHSIQSRTKPNKNWVTNGHIKERGVKEMDPSSEKAPLLAEKAPLLRTNSLGKSVKKNRTQSPTTP